MREDFRKGNHLRAARKKRRLLPEKLSEEARGSRGEVSELSEILDFMPVMSNDRPPESVQWILESADHGNSWRLANHTGRIARHVHLGFDDEPAFRREGSIDELDCVLFLQQPREGQTLRVGWASDGTPRQTVHLDFPLLSSSFDALEIRVAGSLVGSPEAVLADYAARHGRTLEEYDFRDRGNPNVLTAEEIWVTRIIHSRVTHAERAELERVAASCASAWTAIPFDAHIQDADPSVADDLYDDMLRLYTPLTEIPGVDRAKASKVLHFKRPHLYPILDSRLDQIYKDAATTAALDYPERGSQLMYWAAVRNDVVSNQNALCQLRQRLAAMDSTSRLAELSDIRILDILSWSR